MERTTAAALGLAVIAVMAAPTRAPAADWVAAPTLTLALDNDTNRELIGPPIPSKGVFMSFDSSFERNTEQLKLQLHPQLTLERYSDARLSHTDAEGIDATATWRNDERSSLELHTLLRDESTLYSEVGGTGLFRIGTRRRDEEADGSWTHQQTERYTLQLSGSYSSAKYHGANVSALSDYQQSLGSMVESLAWSELLTFSLNASAGDAQQRQGYEQSTRFQSLGIGFEWHPSERLKLAASGGASHQATGSLVSFSTVGQASLSWSTDVGSISLEAQRQMQPSGYGIFTQIDEVTITAIRGLSPRLDLETAADVYRNSSAFQSAFLSFTFSDRTYTRAHLLLDWHQNDTWTLGLQILYDRQDAPKSFLIPQGLSASGWQVSVRSVWAPRGVSLSR